MSCILALCLQLGLGAAYALPQDSGIWYVQSYEHTLHLTSLDYSVGVESSHWRAGVQSMGRTSAQAIVGANVDGTTCVGCPVDHYSGDGKVFGLYAQYIWHLARWRAEFGPWIYRASWQEQVPDYHWACGTVWCVYPTYISSAAWSLGVVGGIGRDFGPYSIALSARMAGDRGRDTSPTGHGYDMPSIIKGGIVDFSIRYTFKD